MTEIRVGQITLNVDAEGDEAQTSQLLAVVNTEGDTAHVVQLLLVVDARIADTDIYGPKIQVI